MAQTTAVASLRAAIVGQTLVSINGEAVPAEDSVVILTVMSAVVNTGKQVEGVDVLSGELAQFEEGKIQLGLTGGGTRIIEIADEVATTA